MAKKYNNKKSIRIINNKIVTFDSILEAKRYDYLYLMAKAEKIRNLTLQKKFILMDGFTLRGRKVRDITYSVDFYYERLVNGEWARYVDDAKGVLTEPTRLRQKLFLEKFGDTHMAINTSIKNGLWIESDF